MKSFLYLSILSRFIISCSSSSVKEGINKVGDVAGQTAGEFAKGVGSGVDKVFDVKIDVSEGLKGKGIAVGKTSVSCDSVGMDNLLSVYIIFEKDFTGNIIAKAFDNKSQEMGRSMVAAEGKSGEAKYIDFHFDKRTNIDSDSKLTLE